MSKELNVYKAIAILEMSAMQDDKMTVEKAEELRQFIEKELEDKDKILKIIKEKRIDVSGLLELDDLQQYNLYCDLTGGCKHLTQEEFELLKEVLL